ncbi:MAG: BCCT family transporter, partial [Bacteroidota bacterium]
MALRKGVFFFPLTLMFLAIVASLLDSPSFILWLGKVNDYLLSGFGWLYAAAVLSGLVLLAVVYFSKWGSVVVGGPTAL